MNERFQPEPLIAPQPELTASFPKEKCITPREIQVLALVAQGRQNKEIAGRLCISIETVKQHLKNIYLKTGAQNKIEALNKTRWLTDPLLAINSNC